MENDPEPQFGTDATSVVLVERPGSYGLAIVGDEVLVVATPAGLYLPGGGIDPEEIAEVALWREVREETGYVVVAAIELGTARQLLRSGINKIETFFLVSVAGELAQNESDHQPQWISIDDAIAGMAEEAQAWALRRARDTSTKA